MCAKYVLFSSSKAMMRTKKLGYLFWMFLLLPATPLRAELYQWIDSRGTIHFTDNLHSVPESLRDSPRLIIREDFEITGRWSETLTPPEVTIQEPILEPKVPEVVRLPRPEPAKVAPTIIDNSQHFTTIVIVNSFVRRSKKRRCLIPEGCRPVFRPNFNDRRFIHPSVFNSGGSRQYIHPESFR